MFDVECSYLRQQLFIGNRITVDRIVCCGLELFCYPLQIKVKGQSMCFLFNVRSRSLRSKTSQEVNLLVSGNFYGTVCCDFLEKQ